MLGAGDANLGPSFKGTLPGAVESEIIDVSLLSGNNNMNTNNESDEIDRPREDFTEEGTKQDSQPKPHLRHVRIQKKNHRYYFQHPYVRLLVAYFIIFCNFFIYAEDPVSHSRSPCTLPVLGNVYSFVVNKYPSGGWAVLKVFLWLLGIITGMLVGKLFVHKLVLKRWMKLSMFQEDRGSWMVMFLTALISLFIFSLIFNAFLSLGGDELEAYKVTHFLGMENKTFMKAAGMGTWMGDFVTAWMVTDMMLQDKLYPQWSAGLRRWWRAGWHRIWMFWIVLFIATAVVATGIVTDFVQWDSLNRDFVSTNEVSRAFLASFILILDLTIVMQDWDFPRFQGNLDIKLPGVDTASIYIRLPRCLRRENWTVHVTGKWFNYGIIFLVIILDLNMWKNQIFYQPFDFGQYTDSPGYIYTVEDKAFLQTANATLLSYDWRSSHINPVTNQSFGLADPKMNSKFLDFAFAIKATAFVPSITVFLVFGLLIWFYGRQEFVVDAFIVDGASVQGIVVETVAEDLTWSQANLTDGGKTDRRPLGSKTAGQSELPNGDEASDPTLVGVQRVSSV